MRRLLPALLLAVLIASPAAADEVWSGPGWYLWGDGGIVVVLFDGPYTSEKACNAINHREITRPLADDDFDTLKACSYFERNPEEESE